MENNELDYSQYVNPPKPDFYHTPDRLEKRKYLVQYMKPSRPVDKQEINLDENFTPIDYPENGELSVERPPFAINISYQPFPDDEVQRLMPQLNLVESGNN